MQVFRIRPMKSKYIYFDNAATSFPKPECVIKRTSDFVRHCMANPGRSSHKLAMKSAEEIYSVRERVCNLLCYHYPERVVFTAGATAALNLAIKTSIKEGSHVLISDIEHNSTLRAVHALKLKGICDYSVFDTDNTELSIKSLLRKETTHVISTLSSNVDGRSVDEAVLSRVTDELGLALILDGSQRIGHGRFDLSKIHFQTLCCAGHKALFGFPGVGFCVFGDDFSNDTFIEGGSGTDSKSYVMPSRLPEHFEAGTLPLPAIVSLGAGIDFILDVGLAVIEEKLSQDTKLFIDMLSEIRGVNLCKGNSGIVTFTHEKLGSEVIAKRLDEQKIAVRSGFHCAPLAHNKLGTYSDGTVRASLSYLNDAKEILRFGEALRKIIL